MELTGHRSIRELFAHRPNCPGPAVVAGEVRTTLRYPEDGRVTPGETATTVGTWGTIEAVGTIATVAGIAAAVTAGGALVTPGSVNGAAVSAAGDGTAGETQTDFPVDAQDWSWAWGGSNQWWYVEVQINDDGSINWWRAPYDGTNTEFFATSPTGVSVAAHTYNWDWIRTCGFDFGYRNHAAADGINTVYARLSISNAFIWPGT